MSLEAYIRKHRTRFIEKDLVEWLEIPSISGSPEHQEDVQRAAKYAAKQLEDIGFTNVRLIQTQGNPLVYGEWLKAPGKPTGLFYGHYDVQSVAHQLEQWQSPPFEPTVRNGAIFARGACDDKGQVMLVFKALEALMKIEDGLPVNLRVLLEGEEEVGSSSVINYCEQHPEDLKCDFVFVADTGMLFPQKPRPALITSLRGSLTAELTVQGARHDLHSGLLGGLAMNPLNELSWIISQLQGRDRHITIPHFYDEVWQPTTREERKFFEKDPFGLARMYEEEMGCGIAGESGYPPLLRVWHLPTMEVIGFVGGFTGERVRGVIPATATAKISFRLPPLQPAAKAYDLFVKAVHRAARPGVQVTVRQWQCSDGVFIPNNPASLAAAAALREVYRRKTLFVGRGSSIHIIKTLFQKLNAPVVMMGFSLPGDGPHEPNEKFELEQFFKGMRVVALFLKKLAL